MKKTCRTCAWRVFENPEKIGSYEHERETNEDCFCLLKDLFTFCGADDTACRDYLADCKENKGE